MRRRPCHPYHRPHLILISQYQAPFLTFHNNSYKTSYQILTHHLTMKWIPWTTNFTRLLIPCCSFHLRIHYLSHPHFNFLFLLPHSFILLIHVIHHALIIGITSGDRIYDGVCVGGRGSHRKRATHQ